MTDQNGVERSMTEYRDAVELMRACAKADHGMALLRDQLGVPLVAGWQQRCLGKLADMAEAKYLRMLEINDLLKRQQEEMRVLLERKDEEGEDA